MLVAGRQSFREQNYDLAEQLFLEAIAEGADEVECRRHLARIYNRRRQWERALEEWTWLHERDRGAVEPLLQVARAHEWLGRHAEAAAGFEAVLRLAPGHVSALRLLARISYNEQRYDLADRLSVELEQVGDDRGKIEAGLFRARIAHYRGNASDAAEHYERVIGLAADHAEAVTFLVRHYLSQRQIEKAEARVAAARRPGTESRDLLWGALIDRASGRIEEASDALLTGLDSFGDDDQYCQHAAEFMMEVGSFEKAEHILLRGLAAAPTSLRLAGRLLQCRMRSDCPPEEIIELCARMLDMHGANEEALLQRGRALSLLGRRREAIADFRTGLNAFPRNLTFWRWAISSLLLLGEEASARALLNEAATVFARRTTEDLCALAEIFDAADLLSEALAHAEAALAIDPHSETARRLTARIQVQLGRFDSAWPLLQSPQAAGRRPIRTARLYAQVAAGRWALEQLNGGAETGAERVFPDRLFDAVVQRAGAQSAATGGGAEGLRILHVTSTLGSGGAERQLASTVAGLARLRNSGIEVELAAEDLNPAHGRDFFLPPIRETGAPVYSLADEERKGTWRDMLARRPETRLWVQAIAAMPAEVTRNALNLLPILLERRPDVVHLWQDSVCIASGIAAVMAGVPRIILATRSTRPIERQRARRYIEPGFRALLRCPRVSLISNSCNGARDYEDWLGLPAGSLGVIHNGYDFASITGRIDDARSQAIRWEFGIPPEAPVLGGVMRCSFEKRPELWTETAIATVRAHPQAHAILVGSGPMLEQIRSRVAECGLTERIHFAGMQRPVEPWMRAMSVLFLSSLTEGLPNVLIEAQALGVPVATMRVGGAPETMREDETGIVIDEGEIDAIAGPIIRLLKDPARRHTFRKNAMAWAASEFSIEAAVEHMLALYRGQQGATPGRGRRLTEPAADRLAPPG
jgi:glycosyltransferase involved in cell wall biosynthesis/tetratricopeptide (TPR) repeat protein